MAGIWRDWRLAALLAAAASAVLWIAPGAGPLAPRAWGAWLIILCAHVSFCADAWHLVRPAREYRPARRLWKGMLAAVAAFLVGDVVQIWAMVTQPLTPELVFGTDLQAGIVVVGAIMATLTLLTQPWNLRTGQARTRFWLDIAIVMVAVAALEGAFLNISLVTPGQLIADSVAKGPVVFAVGAFAAAKLVLFPDRAVSRAAGWALAGGAAIQAAIGGGIASPYAATYHPSLIWAVAVLSNSLLAMSPRLERRAQQVPSGPPPVEAGRYSRLPYLAVLITNLVVIYVLLQGGLSARGWIVLSAGIVSTVLVVVRQLVALAEVASLAATLDARVRELDASLQERDVLATRLQFLADHDPLTGLANRALLARRLQFRDTCAGSGQMILAVIDLDGFKQVNDRFGHGCGDELLVAVAGRIRTCARKGDLVARIGGDEFCVVMSGGREQAVELAQRVVSVIAEPFHVAGVTVTIGASVGVALADPGHTDPDDLRHRADTAMYRAKQAGKGRYLLDPVISRA